MLRAWKGPPTLVRCSKKNAAGDDPAASMIAFGNVEPNGLGSGAAFALLDVEDLEVDGLIPLGELSEEVLAVLAHGLELHAGALWRLAFLSFHAAVVASDDDLATAPGA